MIENPLSTFIVLGSLSFFVFVVSKYVPNPIDKINAILKVLIHEGNPMTKKNWVERINWLSIVLFTLLLVIELIVFGGSSILNSVLPNTDNKNIPSICLITLIFLFLITVYSPLLIILTKGDNILMRKGKNLIH